MVLKRGEFKLKPRQMGIATRDIEEGKLGPCLFEKVSGSGAYYDIECYAQEYVRANHEIWVVGLNNEVTEHTPQEVRSETVLGVPYRVKDESPLPTSMGKHAVTWTDSVLITASGATKLVDKPGSGKKLRVHGVCFSNKHTVSVDVALSEKTDGSNLKFRHILPADGGNDDLNLTDMCWELSEDTALQYYPQAAYSGGVAVSIGYTTEDVA